MDYDLVVIGGGINGAAIARDAALRGYSVTLFEKGDFASGTTQASSRLIHGGLRYLEQFQIGLVFEALREREYLLQTAPHLVRPLEFVLPVYAHSSRSLWYMKLGVMAYDILSFLKSLPNHRFYSALPLLQRVESGLEQKGLRGGITYYDCQCNYPERLTLALIQGAAKEGAIVQNYQEVIGITDVREEQGEIVKVVKIKDVLTGKVTIYRAQLVINAAGPWVDAVTKLLPEKVERQIGGSEGSHIVVKRWSDAPQRAVYVEAKSDGRPIFIIPWRGYVLIGTTDIHYNKDLEKVRPSAKEISYLLSETNQLFPLAQLERRSIVHCYAGVRPLPSVRKEAPGDIPRSHIVNDHGNGVISVVSGKITTHRSLAEEVVDVVGNKLGRRKKCVTKKTPVFGGVIADVEKYTLKLCAKYPAFSQEQIRYLVGMFGTAAVDILKLAQGQAKLRQKISAFHPDILAEVVYCLNKEYVQTLADFLLRRTGIGSGEGQGLDCVELVAKMFAKRHGWDVRKMQHEIALYTKVIKERHRC